MVYLGGPLDPRRRRSGIYLHDPPPGYHPPRPRLPLKDRQRQARQEWVLVRVATVVKNNVWTAVGAGVHAVVGSSGLTSQDYQELDRLARDRGVGVIAAGNFSVMAAVLRRAASMAARHLDRWEIIDYASDDKPDVPSGTSRELAETHGGPGM
jgi:dihydrodipicolinate reductase